MSLGANGLIRWMPSEALERSDAVVNPQRTKMALVDKEPGPAGTFTAHEGIRIYRMTNGFDAKPEACFRYQPDDLSVTDAPTWSPDGSAVAFDEGAGIRVLPVPDLSGDNCRVPAGGDSGRVIVTNGHYPDWGPADVPTGRPAAPAPPAKPAGPKPAPTAPKVTVTAPKLRTALRKGLVVKVAVPGAGKVQATGTSGGRTVARGRATAKRRGTATVRLRFTAAAKRSLARKRKVTIRVTTVVTPRKGKATRSATRVTLAR